jgi:hypothetical protein
MEMLPGLKVDARFITKSLSSDSADLSNLEASKDTNDGSKIASDKLTLRSLLTTL